jgi:hypothetical protein
VSFYVKKNSNRGEEKMQRRKIFMAAAPFHLKEVRRFIKNDDCDLRNSAQDQMKK